MLPPLGCAADRSGGPALLLMLARPPATPTGAWRQLRGSVRSRSRRLRRGSDKLPCRQLLDVVQIGALAGIAERDCDAGSTRPGRAPDAVDVALGHIRDLVVH